MAPVLFAAFIVVPLIELFVIAQVGRVLGLGPTLAALLLVSIAGAWLVKHEGLRAWRRFRGALDAGRIPADEVVDGALVLVGGALMLTPGFVTDAVGLLLVVPLSRRPVNHLIRSRVRAAFGLSPGSSSRRDRGGGPPSAEVIDVEVVDVERDRNPPAIDG